MHSTYTGQRVNQTGPFSLLRCVTLIALSITACLITVPTIFTTPSAEAADGQTRFFASTGRAISGAFLKFYDAYGGLSSFGYPISDPMNENGRTVQYFERQRFEYHPEAQGAANEVQLSRLGVELAPTAAMTAYPRAFDSLSNWTYFQESKHSLKAPFLDYWKDNGGLRLFGYSITEPLMENGLLVQYFERARLEYHPEAGAGRRSVELGLLGTQYLMAHPEIAARLGGDTRSVTVTSRGSEPVHTSQTSVPNSKEAQLLNLINRVRQEQGLGAVSLDSSIRNVALARSKDMAARNYFSHTTPDGANFLSILGNANISYRYASEIIANNNYSDSDATVQAYNGFMNSPHHHEIIMDPRYTLAGVGEAADAKGFHYFTVIFVSR